MIVKLLKIKPYPSLFAGYSVLLLSCAVIVAWFLDIEDIKNISSHYISMKFNTALCFVLISISLLLRVKDYKPCIIASVLALFVAVIGLISFSQEIFNYNSGIDELFIKDVQARFKNEAYPGRMSPLTAISFFLMGTGVHTLRFKQKKIINATQYVFHFVTLLSFIAIVGYIFGVPKFYKFSFVTSMALHTAVAFFVLSNGASLLNPDAGFTAIFTGKGVGNRVGTQLFMQMFLFVVIFTYLRLQTHRYSYVNVEFGIVLMAISFIIISLFLIWKASYTINKSEVKQKIAEEHFKLVVESVPNALIVSDSTGEITLVNVQAEKLFGYKREDMVGKKIEMLIPQKFRSYHPNNRNSYHKAPVSRFFGAGRELYAVRSDGSEFPVEIGLNPISTTDGGNIVLASIIDITERKKQEALIERQIIELQVKNQEMEQFNYIASHDLQEPLRTVSNYIQLLEEDYEDELNDDIKFHLKTMDSAVSRMSMLVRSLLDFGRLGRNKKLKVTDCNILLEDVTNDLNNLIQTTGTEIITDTALPKTYVYQTEFRQLLQNLINNAIKFRKKDVPSKIIIGCNTKTRHFEFYVKDNGIGIEEKYSHRIFQIFQRLNKQEEYEGHGIGLANCRKISEMHGGRIWVESIPGVGSTFKFTILKLENENTFKLHNAG
ncbi:sensor histidine kinase [Flavobacterium rhizosphaerae]|uniref:histidine kinase n=1 Tax=Flavobacterium rhizosphaerae TaxID=3163298 RepID=A0ABW8YZ17_9FLAO